MIKMHLINFQKRSRGNYKKNLNTIILLIDYDKNVLNQIKNQLDIEMNVNNTLKLNNSHYSLLLDERVFSSERTNIDFYNKIVNHHTLDILRENISKVNDYSILKEINNMTDTELRDNIDSDNLINSQSRYFCMNKIPYIEETIPNEFYLENFEESCLKVIFKHLFNELGQYDMNDRLFIYTLAELFLSIIQSNNIIYEYSKTIDKKYYRSIFIDSLFN
ncbi:hypothetical protein [Staphylococcus phage vB_StaM_SA1]|nr:hypothetical protein [Staphylococcus phage vB_StaM_SA1]